MYYTVYATLCSECAPIEQQGSFAYENVHEESTWDLAEGPGVGRLWSSHYELVLLIEILIELAKIAIHQIVERVL